MAANKKKLTVPVQRLKGDPNLTITINGKTWLIPRGVEVEVPAYVAEEYERAQAAESYMFERQREEIEKAQKAELG